VVQPRAVYEWLVQARDLLAAPATSKTTDTESPRNPG
jgi:trehalose 6-phosphate phosphatase